MALLYDKETYAINGAMFEVHKNLGPGLLEKVYQEAFAIELKLRNIPFEREKRYKIVYKGLYIDTRICCRFRLLRQNNSGTQICKRNARHLQSPSIKLPKNYRLKGCIAAKFQHSSYQTGRKDCKLTRTQKQSVRFRVFRYN